MMAFPHRSHRFYDRTIRRTYDHFGKVFVDALRLEKLNTRSLVSVKNRSCLDEALKEGKGTILLSGHLGNWEIIPLWLAQMGYEVCPVVKRQKNRGANLFFINLRNRTGTFPVYSRVSSHDIVRILHSGRIVGLASDQDARRKGVFVPFFGIPTSTPRGAAVFHLKTKSPLVLAICLKNPNGTYRLKFERISANVERGDAVATITGEYTSRLENEIRKHPEQYFWYHRRWKTKPRRHRNV